MNVTFCAVFYFQVEKKKKSMKNTLILVVNYNKSLFFQFVL